MKPETVWNGAYVVMLNIHVSARVAEPGQSPEARAAVNANETLEELEKYGFQPGKAHGPRIKQLPQIKWLSSGV